MRRDFLFISATEEEYGRSVCKNILPLSSAVYEGSICFSVYIQIRHLGQYIMVIN